MTVSDSSRIQAALPGPSLRLRGPWGWYCQQRVPRDLSVARTLDLHGTAGVDNV